MFVVFYTYVVDKVSRKQRFFSWANWSVKIKPPDSGIGRFGTTADKLIYSVHLYLRLPIKDLRNSRFTEFPFNHYSQNGFQYFIIQG